MEDLKDVYISPLPEDSLYMKPVRMHYTQGGRAKSWDLLEVHDSVVIIVFNVTRRVMVFVEQFRPAIYYNSIPREERQKGTIDANKYPASLGLALEMCAGIVDKDKPLEEIAREEVLEECGYNVAVTDLQKILTYRNGVGIQGALQTLYYCEVTDDMKTEKGGGVDDEIIAVVEKPLPAVRALLSARGALRCPPSCLFPLEWFLHHKAAQFEETS